MRGWKEWQPTVLGRRRRLKAMLEAWRDEARVDTDKYTEPGANDDLIELYLRQAQSGGDDGAR